LGITPWHPVFIDGEWQFPADLVQKAMADPSIAHTVGKVSTEIVYNFILESVHSSPNADLLTRATSLTDHTVIVNNVPAVCFGHGLETNAVVKHNYWGNMQAILRDVRVMQGFDSGKVVLQSETCCIKDPNTRLVVKMIQTPLLVSGCDELTDGCHFGPVNAVTPMVQEISV